MEDFKEVSKEQMEWLKNGGRNRIERMAKRFMKIWDKARRSGDFYVSIDLPSDILVVAKRKDAGGSVFRFNYDKMDLAQKAYEQIKEHYDDLETLAITNLKDYFSLESDLIIRTDVGWHGDDAYWQGWDFCRTFIPIELFPHGLRRCTEND